MFNVDIDELSVAPAGVAGPERLLDVGELAAGVFNSRRRATR
jgi:hypothetical protein